MKCRKVRAGFIIASKSAAISTRREAAACGTSQAPKRKSKLGAEPPKVGRRAKSRSGAVTFVSGIMDQATLNRVAQGYYEMQGRGEIEAEVKTKKPQPSFGGA